MPARGEKKNQQECQGYIKIGRYKKYCIFFFLFFAKNVCVFFPFAAVKKKITGNQGDAEATEFYEQRQLGDS